ncbi:hypothetical protein [Cellulomonas sp. KRMCY2]|uniref:hypothetical protein n=1 Tax=Cellulomonas sp. KRMCY2 TaxID=1304865 RepID=UPI001E651905|nr:hypothetical protein [Cellulomonas sp. KRMCY2]
MMLEVDTTALVRGKSGGRPGGSAGRATPVELDPEVPRRGSSRYVDLRLTTLQMADPLSRLHVLPPALDADEHYGVGHDVARPRPRRGFGSDRPVQRRAW